MKYYITAYCAVAVLALMTGCTEDISQETDASESQRMTFSVQTTRAAQATAATLAGGFGVSASSYPKDGNYTQYGCGSLFHCVKVIPNTPTAYYWPTSDYKVSFYAYYPYGNSAVTISKATTTGKQTYTFTQPQDVADHFDFMTAERTDMTAGPQAAVTLTFKHQLAGVRFSVYNQQNDALTVSRIIILNAVKSAQINTEEDGTFYDGDMIKNWTDTQLACSTTVESGATVDITGTDNHFFMFPAVYRTGRKLFLVNTVEDGENRAYFYTLPSAIEWKAGKVYHYKLTLGNGKMTVSTISVVDWEEITTTTGSFSVNNWTAQ